MLLAPLSRKIASVMKRVLFAITGLERAGAEVALVQLISQLKEAGVQCGCISLRDGPCHSNLVELGIPTFVAERTLGGLRFYNLFGAIRFAKQFKPDVLQGWMYHGNILGLLLKWGVGGATPLIWGIRSGLYGINQKRWSTALAIRLGAPLSSRAQAVIYNSYRSAERHEQFGYCAERARVILNGIDTQYFAPNSERRQSVRKRLGVPSASMLLGVIARNHPDKDPLNFLNALALVSQGERSVRGVMVGKGYERLKGLPLSKELEGRGVLSYLDSTEDVLSVMQALDVLVCPSRSESFPNVVAEAMSCGVSCVVTDVGDAALLVGECGKVVAPGNSRILADAILSIIRLEPKERAAGQQLSRKRIVEQFSIERMRDAYLSLYSENKPESA